MLALRIQAPPQHKNPLPFEELNRFAVVDTEDLWGNPRIKNY